MIASLIEVMAAEKTITLHEIDAAGKKFIFISPKHATMGSAGTTKTSGGGTSF
jgi:hypothetical protein